MTQEITTNRALTQYTGIIKRYIMLYVSYALQKLYNEVQCALSIADFVICTQTYVMGLWFIFLAPMVGS